MIIQIEENSQFAELILELKKRYDNELNIYPQEWLNRGCLRGNEDD